MQAIDISLTEAKSTGVAYYRLPKEVKEFFDKCEQTHGVVGFEYEFGTWNFGVILGEKLSGVKDK